MNAMGSDDIARRGHPVWAEIDLGALRRNVRALRALAPRAEFMGVVKGYAYGHGNPACAIAMLDAGAARLGVARVAEALHLREAGVDAPIHVFTEPPPEAAATLIRHGLTPTIYTEAFARSLSDAATALGTRVAAHLKIDTGMHRVGVQVEDVPAVVGVLAGLRGVEVEGAWSHFAVADVPDHPFTRKQLDTFVDVVGKLERSGVDLRYRHIANSAATLSLPESHLDIVRCGIACYGLSPGAGVDAPVALEPVLSLKARVNMIKTVHAGEGLSYGLRYAVQRESRVVTVPAGYADGYDRRLTGRAEVLMAGNRYRVSGAVCMDQFMVDVGEDEIPIGGVATLIGRDGDDAVTAEELAEHSGTINYEVTARIPSRVPRLYVDGDRTS